MSLFDIAFYFVLYSFLGWVVEVVFHVFKEGHLINRGFLAGPVCPVYGFGMIGILELLHYLSTGTQGMQLGILPTFFIGMIVCTCIEFIAGWLLDVIFQARWWDYREEKWNLNGYVCLRFSILWGIGVVFLIYVVHPLFTKIPLVETQQTIYWIILALMYAVYAVDFILTVSVLIGLNKRLKEIDKLQDQLSMLSDSLTIAIGDASLSAMATAEKAEEKREEWKEAYQSSVNKGTQRINESREAMIQRIATLKSKLYQGRNFTMRRLWRAFPTMTSRTHFESFEELKEYFKNTR